MTPPLLLDTCAVIWIMENMAMTPAAVSAIDAAADRGNALFISPITGWELGLQFAKGRLRSPLSPGEYLRRAQAIRGIELAQMPPELLLQSSFLPGTPPSDPADRILAATAREYGFTLLTRDRALLAYAGEGHILALAC